MAVAVRLGSLAGAGSRRRAGTALLVIPALLLVTAQAGVGVETGTDAQAEAPAARSGPRDGVEPPVTEPVQPRRASDVSVAEERPGAGEELLQERTATSKTFATGEPGVFESELFSAPVHFRAGKRWEEIQTALVPDGAGSGRVVNAANAFEASVAAGADDAQLVSVDLGGGRSVAWSMQVGVERASPAAGARSVEGSRARFGGVAPKVGVEVTSTARGVKEDIVLSGKDAPAVFFFPLELEGLRVQEAEGGLVLTDGATGVPVGRVPAGFMVDAAEEVSDAVEISLVGTASAPVMKVQVDAAWLAEPARVFPVRVDPTVQFDSVVDDTYVLSTQPDGDFSAALTLRAGLNPWGAVMRSFLRFDVSSVQGKTINWAELELWNNHSATCTPTKVTVEEVTAAWTGSTAGWPGPARGDIAGSVWDAKGGPECDAGWITARVSQLVREWTGGEKDNHGMAVVANENNADAFKRFASSETGANGPVLRVSWRESLLGTLGYYTLNTAELTDRLQMHANPGNGNLVLEAADLRLPGVAGTDFAVGRYYNSREDTEQPGMAGTGWTLSVGQDIQLHVSSRDQSGFFQGPSGYRLTFPYDRDTGGYGQPAGLNASLTRDGASNDYTVEFHETGLRYHFAGGGPALSSIEDQNGNEISFTYQGGQLVTVTDTKGRQTAFEYNVQGLVERIAAPNGREIGYQYQGSDLVASTDPTGQVTTYDYDAEHNLVAVTDPRGGTTGYGYDSQDRLVQVEWADSTPAEPAVTTYDYLSDNRVALFDPNGNEWFHVFDDKGRIEVFYSPRSGVGETYAYDAFNSVTDYTTDEGGIGTLSYDGYNVLSVQSDNGALSTFKYQDPDTAHRPSKYTDPRGVALSYDWDDKQQLSSVTANNGSATTTTAMNYRSPSQACSGELASQVDGRGSTTTYSYDAKCRLIMVDRPAPAGDTTMTYDAYDRVVSITDGNGNKQTISYDANDRITSIEYREPGEYYPAGSVAYAYDGNGNRTQRTDDDGTSLEVTTWALDARNRVTTEALPNVTNTYDYDPAGNLASHTGPWGTTAYGYDDENDVSQISLPTGDTVTFEYFEHSYAAVRFPNGVVDAQHYDTDGRIQRIDQYFYDQAASVYRQLADWNYDYTHPGTGAGTNSVYGITDPDYNLAVDYVYDNQGRIKSSYGTSHGDVFEDHAYSYDANSNKTQWSEYGATTTATYNAADQLTSTTTSTGTTTYSYDNVGNLTGGTDGTAIDYDVRNQATNIDHPYSADGPQAGEYDGTSQFERTRYGDLTFTNSILGVTSSTDGTGTTYYLRAPDGRVLGQHDPQGRTWYYLTDRLGSITGVTDQDGWRVNDYGYGPYGEYTYGSDAYEGPSLSAPVVHFRYTGAWLDGTSVTGTGYYKIGLRYYDQRIGRWTQPDPLERAINPTQPAETQPYNYAGCNPTNQTDPTGAISLDCVLSSGMFPTTLFMSAVALLTLIYWPVMPVALTFLAVEPLTISLGLYSIARDCA